VAEKKERFELAWDIEKFFDDMRVTTWRNATETLERKMDEVFKGYLRKEAFTLDGTGEEIVFYKPDWVLDEGGCILAYTYEKSLFRTLFGIRKYSDDIGIPFKGPWTEADLAEDEKKALTQLFLSMEMLYQQLEATWTLDRAPVEPWIHPEGPRGGDWLFTLDLPDFQEMEFYEMMIDSGLEATLDRYMKYVTRFRVSSERYISGFVKRYKKRITQV